MVEGTDEADEGRKFITVFYAISIRIFVCILSDEGGLRLIETKSLKQYNQTKAITKTDRN